MHGDGRVHPRNAGIDATTKPSGFGFELSFRLKRGDNEETPPTWPAAIMQALARYVFKFSEYRFTTRFYSVLVLFREDYGIVFLQGTCSASVITSRGTAPSTAPIPSCTTSCWPKTRSCASFARRTAPFNFCSWLASRTTSLELFSSGMARRYFTSFVELSGTY